ncbi:MAG: hypothetical protein JJU10_10515 [Idiomarina sp.]|nr:hypothetical protein [Idiomarina sp.]
MSTFFLIVVVVAIIAVLVIRRTQGPKIDQAAVEAKSQAVDNTKQTQVKAKEAVAEVKSAAKHTTEAVKQEAKQVVNATKAAVEGDVASPDVPEELQESALALASEQDSLVRHRHFQNVTESAYKKRKDPLYRSVCDYFSAQHIAEFEAIAKPLKKSNGGKLPQVLTFQNYANLLLEDGRFDEAIEVCEKALGFGLDDKTQTGFKGRIERIRAKQSKA